MSITSDPFASRSLLADQVVAAIKAAIGSDSAVLHEPSFVGNEWRYVKECLDSTFVSSVGKFVDQFESALTDFTGARHAVAVVNGTAALHISLQLVNVKPGDEVLVPALTFVATANAITYCGAIPHFVDSEERTCGIDPTALRKYLTANTEQRAGVCFNKKTGRAIRALLPVHVFGHPVDIEGLLAIAHDFNLALVEDAAESLGSTYRQQHTGTFGQLGTLSFNGNKTITTGGGGAILTNDPRLAKHAKHITTTSKLPHSWEFVHDEIGYNYRLPNLNAALGCAQLESLPSMLAAKRKLFFNYQHAFKSVEGVKILSEPSDCQSNYWLQTMCLAESHAQYRDEILRATNNAGYMTRPVWQLLHNLKPFVNCPRMELHKSESLAGRLINVPSSSNLLALQ